MSNESSLEFNIAKWAREMLAEIYHLEISLGNIIPKDQQSPWFTKNFKDILDRVESNTKADAQKSDSVQRNLDERIEFLFTKIVTGLTAEGLSPETIANSINLGVPTGSRLSYCDVSSVQEILDQQKA